MTVLASAMNSIIAKRRVEAALKRDVPHSVENTYKAGDEVMTYRGKERKCIGPKCVAKVEDEIIFVKNEKRTLQPFHKQQITPNIQKSHLYLFESFNRSLTAFQ